VGALKLATQMALLRKIFWLAIFVFATLCFVVLFEKGTNNFVPNVQKQFQEFSKMVQDQITPPKTAKP